MRLLDQLEQAVPKVARSSYCPIVTRAEGICSRATAKRYHTVAVSNSWMFLFFLAVSYMSPNQVAGAAAGGDDRVRAHLGHRLSRGQAAVALSSPPVSTAAYLVFRPRRIRFRPPLRGLGWLRCWLLSRPPFSLGPHRRRLRRVCTLPFVLLFHLLPS